MCVLTSSYPLHAHDMSGWFVQEQCRHLAEDQGVELTVLAPGHPGVPAYERHGRIEVRRLSYFFPSALQRLAYGSGVMSNLRSRPVAWLNLVPFLLVFCLKTIRFGRRADIVHAHWGPLGALATLTRFLHGRPVVVSVRGSDILGAGRLVRMITAWAVRRGSAVSANTPVSHAVASSFCHKDALCRYVPNGLDLPALDQLQARRLLKTDPDVALVSAGRLIPERRYDLLIRAVARLNTPSCPITLTLVGDGPERKALESLVDELGVRDRVRLAGRVARQDVARYLAEADVYVSATESDNFANAVLEGAAHALPVVATRVGFPAEVVLDGQTGFLVEPGNLDALCDALRKLLVDPDGRRQAGLRMRQRVEELGLTWYRCAERTAELYRDVLHHSGKVN